MSVRGSGDRGGREAESRGSHSVSGPNAVEMAQEGESRGQTAKGSLDQAGGGDMSFKGPNMDATKLVGWALSPHEPRRVRSDGSPALHRCHLLQLSERGPATRNLLPTSPSFHHRSFYYIL